MRLIEAPGGVYPEARRFLAGVKIALERERTDREHLKHRQKARTVLRLDVKSIDVFRNDARYDGDGNRIDLAYSIYALSHGASQIEVATTIRSRDLSHKGNERRQSEYVERTIEKALAAIERGR